MLYGVYECMCALDCHKASALVMMISLPSFPDVGSGILRPCLGQRAKWTKLRQGFPLPDTWAWLVPVSQCQSGIALTESNPVPPGCRAVEQILSAVRP